MNNKNTKQSRGEKKCVINSIKGKDIHLEISMHKNIYTEEKTKKNSKRKCKKD